VTLTSSASSGNQWYQGGSPIGGASGQIFVTNASGSYSVTVTTNGCTSAPSGNAVITVNPLPSASITAPSSIVTATTAVATVPNAGAGASYAWTIGNGSINSGSNTNNIAFTAGVPGPMSLDVAVTNGSSCTANGSVAPTVISDVLFEDGFE
jgi:hypothetical protein